MRYDPNKYDPKKDLIAIHQIRRLFRVAERILGRSLPFDEEGLRMISRSNDERALRVLRLIWKVIMRSLERHAPLIAKILEPYKQYGHDNFHDIYSMAIDGFIHALFKFDRSKNVKFSSYFVLWVKSRANAFLRDNVVHASLDDFEVPPRSTWVHPNDDTARVDLDKAISALGDRDRDIVWKYAALGYTYEEIAREYGVSRQRIEQLYKKSLKRMREQLEAR